MEKSFTFPSVLEENYRDFEKVVDDFLDGIKIADFSGKDYIIGNLALKEGLSPHKLINSSAADIDYQLLGSTGLIVAAQGTYSNLIVTTGFPFSTYQPFRDGAVNFFKKQHSINLDTRPLGGTNSEQVKLNVQELHVMTEVEGAVKYIREGELKEKKNFILASIGYGTFELALSRQSGIVYRTAASANGIIYAIKLMAEELQKSYYYNILTDQQFERAFQRGSIIVNRRKVDLSELRDKILETYYKEVISPAIRRSITDEDFYDIDRIYIVGGGGLYPKIMEMFNTEFKDIIQVILVPSPNLAASKGYCLKSVEIAKEKINILEDKDSYACVGLDLGNNNTVVSVTDEF